MSSSPEQVHVHFGDHLFSVVQSVSRAIEQRETELLNKQLSYRCTAAEVQAINAQQRKCWYLDVGGTAFHTSSDVMGRHGPHFLSVLASGEYASEADDGQYVFIDRDNRWFAIILEYLRDGTPATGATSACAAPGDIGLYRHWFPDKDIVVVPSFDGTTIGSPTPHIVDCLRVGLPGQDRDSWAAAWREARYYGLEGLARMLEERTFFVVFGMYSDTFDMWMAMYDLRSGRWQSTKLPDDELEPRHCCSIEGRIYVICSKADAIHSYDPGTGCWECVIDLPVDLWHCAIRLHHVGEYLVVSGCPNFGLLYAALHLKTRQWHRLERSFRGVDFGSLEASCVIDDQWLIFGSWSGAAVSVSHFPTTLHKSDIPEPPGGHRNEWDHPALAWNGKAVLVGAEAVGNNRRVDVYDPITSAWSLLPPLPLDTTLRHRVAAAVVDGNVVVMGCTRSFRGSAPPQTWTMATYCHAIGRWQTTIIPSPIPDLELIFDSYCFVQL